MKNKQQIKFNELPTRIAQKDFNQYILPYLSKGKRGPQPKISLYKTFNYILYILHTGCQWDMLPIRNREVHWSAVYAKHNRWSKDGSYENIFLHSVKVLREQGKLDLSVLHGDGSNTVAKKGAKPSVGQDRSTTEAKKR